MGEITQLLESAGAGQPGARERLYSRIYDELRGLARSRLGP